MHRKSFLAFRIRGLEALTEAEGLGWLFRNKIPDILCSQHFGNRQDKHPALYGCSAAPVPGKVWNGKNLSGKKANQIALKFIWKRPQTSESPFLASNFQVKPLFGCFGSSDLWHIAELLPPAQGRGNISTKDFVWQRVPFSKNASLDGSDGFTLSPLRKTYTW